MHSESFVWSIFVAFGLWGVLALIVVAASWPVLQHWLSQRIVAGVERELQERLATHQHELDSLLEIHRSNLDVDRDRLRSSLDKSIADYCIYAERRANAITTLFGAFLAAELKAVDRSMFSLPDVQELSPDDLESLLQQLQTSPRLAREIRDEFARSRHADGLVHNAAKALKQTLAFEARNEASDAYFRAALYLPPDVNQAALAVKDYFHTIAGDHVLPSDRGPNYAQHKTQLRFLMLGLQIAARAELSASASILPLAYPPSRSPSASLTTS